VLTPAQRGVWQTKVCTLNYQKAVGLLQELEALHLIKVLKDNIAPPENRLSRKYKGILTKEQGQNLNEHLQQMRGEWNNN
jgi:hypothetical protein